MTEYASVPNGRLAVMVRCSMEGCERSAHCRTFCKMHYERWRVHGDPTIVKPKGAVRGHVKSSETRRKISAHRHRWMLSKAGLEFRGRMRERMRGSRHPQWKGDDVTYAAAHYRVYAARGRPERCEECGSRVHLDWANLSHDYPNPDDYIALCRSCHTKRDGIVRNLGPYAIRGGDKG